jgi:polyketide synthase 12/myxalamid-type polyketide synthase MxaB
VHAAGLVDDGMLVRQTPERFARVLGPKASGALALDESTRTLPLDFFVMFSSVASVFGSPGQANYAAANAVLDALAHDRQRRGLAALSVNWGPWADAGMAARVAEDRRRDTPGLSPLQPAQALDALEALLGAGVPQAAVVEIDWSAFLRQFPAGGVPPLLSDFAGAADPSRTASAPAGAGALEALLEAAAPDDRLGVAREFLTRRAMKALGLPPDGSIDPDQPLDELGLDSLMAVELTNDLSAASGRTLPVSMLAEHRTIASLARRLAAG